MKCSVTFSIIIFSMSYIFSRFSNQESSFRHCHRQEDHPLPFVDWMNSFEGNSSDSIVPVVSTHEFPQCMMLLRVIAAYGRRALGPHTADVQAHPGATTFPPVEYFDHCLSSSDGSTRFPQHPFSAHDHGRLRSHSGFARGFSSKISRSPDCTWSRLPSREYDRPVTQSMATHGATFCGPHEPPGHRRRKLQCQKWVGRDPQPLSERRLSLTK